MVAKRKTRVQVTMDNRLLEAVDKFIENINQREVSSIQTRSNLIETALLMYFDTLAERMSLTKGENTDEN